MTVQRTRQTRPQTSQRSSPETAVLIIDPDPEVRKRLRAKMVAGGISVDAIQESAHEPLTPEGPGRLPAGTEGVVRLAQAAVERGAYEDALAWFDAACRLDPSSIMLRLCRGACLEGLGRLEAAKAAYRAALAVDPGAHSVALRLAAVEAETGEDDEALATLEDLLAMEPHLIEVVAEHPSFDQLRDHPRFHHLSGLR